MYHFSSNSIPARRRLAVLHEFVGQHIASRKLRPLDSAPNIDVTAMKLRPDTSIASLRFSPIVFSRTPDLMADGRDDFMLTIHSGRHDIAVESRSPVTIDAGDLIMLSHGVRSEIQLPAIDARMLTLSRTRMAELMPRLDSQAFHHVRAGSPGLAMLGSYAALLYDSPPRDVATSDVTSRHLYELVALVLGGFAGGDDASSERSIRAARLELIKRLIAKRLHDPNLTIGTIAALQRITPRYVQKLFGETGTTFSAFVLASRLERAYAALRSGAFAGSVSALAYDCGFNDLSHFNRSFRRHFGSSPSAVRAAAMLTAPATSRR